MSQDDKPREYWILTTPGGQFIEYDEPMSMDWAVCSKVQVIERAAYDRLAKQLEHCAVTGAAVAQERDRLAAELAECRSDLQLHRQKLESCYSSDEYAQLKQALAEQMAGALEIALSSVEPQISKPADEALAAWREFGTMDFFGGEYGKGTGTN